ncbi:MAG: hypothetical protein KAT77_06065 [Nanoarchaeota archaeon]|nr:hypothetical protein [Nanoarchaeota archaeon]
MALKGWRWKMEKTLELLIVEDNEKHLADAKAEVAKLQDQGKAINVTYATNYKEAQDAIQTKKYDGIVSDIFMPSEGEENYTFDIEAVRKLLPKHTLNRDECAKAAERWLNGNDLAPLGVLIIEETIQKEIPALFCTDTYHHGKKTEPVIVYARNKEPEIIMIDDHNAREGSVNTKKWELALNTLTALIEVTKMPLEELKANQEEYSMPGYSEEINLKLFGAIYNRLEGGK